MQKRRNKLPDPSAIREALEKDAEFVRLDEEFTRLQKLILEKTGQG